MSAVNKMEVDQDPGFQDMTPTLRSVFTMYPQAKSILEVGCRKGVRIKSGRVKGVNVFGVDTGDYHRSWETKKIDLYCKVVEAYSLLPYSDNSFEWVITAEPISWSWKVIRELQRVCYGYFYYKFPLNGEIGHDIVGKLLEMGHIIEIVQPSFQKTFIVEGRTG